MLIVLLGETNKDVLVATSVHSSEERERASRLAPADDYVMSFCPR